MPSTILGDNAALPPDRALSIDVASCTSSPTGTKCPYFPFLRTSAGPVGQSVDTQGVPVASAWISTLGKPSLIDDNTKTSANAK